MKTKIFTLIFCCLPLFNFGQNEDFLNNLFLAGTQDAETYLQNYLEPMFVAYGYGMANGWYASAKTHKTLGFDFNVSFNVAKIPSGKDFFTFVESQYTTLALENPQDNQLATAFGPTGTGPGLGYRGDTLGLTTFSSPGGLGVIDELPFKASIPAPTIQLGVGIWRSTDLIFRYIPNLSFGEYSVGSFGFGIKHNIKQWIPVVKRIPIDISILLGYSRLKNEYDISADESINIAGRNQIGKFDVNNFNAQLLVGKKISIVTFYVGGGYVNTTTNFKLLGEYDLAINGVPIGGEPLVNPVDMKFKNNTFLFSGGMRLKFGPFYIYGQYTVQEYDIISAGFGLDFRED